MNEGFWGEYMSWTSMLFGTASRIRRRDFWIWIIAKTIVLFILAALAVAGINLLPVDQDHRTYLDVAVMCVTVGLFAGINACLIVKRWHDRNKSGWMYFILVIPYIGWAWTLIECGLVDGTEGRNRYGKSPKGITYSGDGMRLRTLVAFKSHWFVLGIDDYSGQHYLAIPLSNRTISYEEYYRLDKDQFETFKSNVDLGMAFADKCRNREMDHLLIIPAILERGTA